ncbi:MAG: adenosylmethionine decarboxylase [Nitrospirota bacterium]
MHALGTHLLVELKDCTNLKLLNDVKRVEEALVLAAKEAKATIIETCFHKFSPFGISGVVVIAESHLTIHTWPEYGFAAVDIFTCGDTLQPEVAASYLIGKFKSRNPSIVEMKRGLISNGDVKLPYKHASEVYNYGGAQELQMAL